MDGEANVELQDEVEEDEAALCMRINSILFAAESTSDCCLSCEKGEEDGGVGSTAYRVAERVFGLVGVLSRSRSSTLSSSSTSVSPPLSISSKSSGSADVAVSKELVVADEMDGEGEGKRER